MNSAGPGPSGESFAAAEDLTVGIEEEFSILDPDTLDLVPRFEELKRGRRRGRGARARRSPAS